MPRASLGPHGHLLFLPPTGLKPPPRTGHRHGPACAPEARCPDLSGARPLARRHLDPATPTLPLGVPAAPRSELLTGSKVFHFGTLINLN